MASSWSNFRSSGNSRNHVGHAYNYERGAQHIQHNGTGPINTSYTYNERGRTREREQEVDSQLQGASRSDSEERVKSLINVHGAHPWCADQDGMTPLHHASASAFDNIAILKMLIDNAADIDAVNKAGESPLRLAINQKGDHSAKANYIRARGGKDIDPSGVHVGRAAPPPQRDNAHNRNIAHDGDFIRDRKSSPHQSITSGLRTPSNLSTDLIRPSSHGNELIRRIRDFLPDQDIDERVHRRRHLEMIAARIDFVDDFRPQEYNDLSYEDRRTVLAMAPEHAPVFQWNSSRRLERDSSKRTYGNELVRLDDWNETLSVEAEGSSRGSSTPRSESKG